MHSVIIKNSEDVRESAHNFVNDNCIEDYPNQEIVYDDETKQWKRKIKSLPQ